MSGEHADIDARLARIEQKLDTLIAALAEEGEAEPQRSLDGELGGRERDQTQGLG